MNGVTRVFDVVSLDSVKCETVRDQLKVVLESELPTGEVVLFKLDLETFLGVARTLEAQLEAIAGGGGVA